MIVNLFEDVLRLLFAVEAAKRHSRKLDYNDMIMKTHALLHAEDSAPRKHLSTNIVSVLVDEFLDKPRASDSIYPIRAPSRSRPIPMRC